MVEREKIATAAIIRNENKILLAQRKKDSWLEPNKWEFPGGKVESSETYEECLIREIKEELGITISINRFLIKTTHNYVKDSKIFPITLMAYIVDWVEGEVKNIDCQDSCWVELEDLRMYNFAAADIPILNEFLSSLKNLINEVK
jgi:8-oxo-dGTP diphosphatase